jgi:predicted Zn-dependent peptidase
MNQVYIYLVIPNYGYNDKNINEIKLFTNILGNKKLFTNILFNILREKHGVSYNITVDNMFLKNSGYTYVLIKVNHTDLNKSITILQNIILQIIKDCKTSSESINSLITKDKFNKIKYFLLNDINTIYDNIDNIESFYVDNMIYQYKLFNINDYKNNIKNVKYNNFKSIIHNYLQKYIIYIFS